jgi:hypothetical protein
LISLKSKIVSHFLALSSKCCVESTHTILIMSSPATSHGSFSIIRTNLFEQNLEMKFLSTSSEELTPESV